MISPVPLEGTPSLAQFIATRRKPTLLIVDDEEGVRQSVRLVFKDDFNVMTTGDGSSAIEIAQTEQIDVAILDIRMAGMTGIEVLERLKIVDPTIEVVMMTAYETSETMKQALRLQACDYLNKPFEIGTLRQAVAKALQRRNFTSEIKTNTERLERLQTELQQSKIEGERVRTHGEIYASVIHDINGPLTIMSGLLHSVNQRLADETSIQGEELELMKDRLKRVTRQVTNCIEISRRYLGLMRQNQQHDLRVWVNQMLSDLGELVRAHPHSRNNQLLIQPLQEDIAVPIHGTDLLQIFLNLTLNALQCAPNQHRVEIQAQMLDQALNLKHFQDGAEDYFLNREGFLNAAPLLAISVQDNGPGMAPDILPKIFEPYFTTQVKRNGTGLGLCIVHRLVKLAQGGIHVHSKVGQGSVFTVYLPAGTTGK